MIAKNGNKNRESSSDESELSHCTYSARPYGIPYGACHRSNDNAILEETQGYGFRPNSGESTPGIANVPDFRPIFGPGEAIKLGSV